MRPEMRDKFLTQIDATSKSLGGTTIEDGIDLARRALSKFLEMLEPIQTREMLIRSLDQLEIPIEWEQLLVQAAENGPLILRWIAMKLNQSAEESLPKLPHRGPAVNGRTQGEILHYFGKLTFEQGIKKQIAKSRTAQKFGCSVRQVERLLQDRVKILADGPRYHFNDLIAELQRAWKEDGSPILLKPVKELGAESGRTGSERTNVPV